MKQSQIAGGKGVRFAECTHGDVLRRPVADSRELPKLLEKIGDVHYTIKRSFAVTDSPS